MEPTIVLITGANRGIGKGILELYLKKPNHTVIAANRDPSHPTSQDLVHLPKADGTVLIIVKIDYLSASDQAAAATELSARGINHIDILVANAGLALSWPKIIDVDIEEIQKHVDVNVNGFIRLYQAFQPFLRETKEPKWVTIGSGGGYLTVSDTRIVTRNFVPARNAAYGPTKCVQHWYTKAISIEDPWLNAFPVEPGWVQTDIGNRAAATFGLKEAAITVDESANGVMKIIDEATLESHSGRLFKSDGTQEPW